MRICLINPKAAFLADAGVFPPLGLYYLSSALKHHGYWTRIVDVNLGETIPPDYDVYGITGTSVQLGAIQEALNQLPTSSKITTIAGGPFASAEPERALEMGFDHVIIGEGEYYFPMLVKNLIRNIESRPIIGPTTIPDISLLQMPDRSQAYKYNHTHNGKKFTTAITSRGCPFKCAFCSRVGDDKVRYNSAEKVVSECRYIGRLGFQGIYFYDDTFNMNLTRLRAMQPGLSDTGLEYRCMARAHLMTDEVSNLMYKSGFRTINVGVESGSDTILSAIHKGETTTQILEGIQCALDAGLEVKAYLVVGLPGENPKTLEETYEFCRVLKGIGVLDFNFHLLQVLPGSDIWNHPTDYDVTFSRGTHLLTRPGEFVVTSHTSQCDEQTLQEFHTMINKEFKTWSI